MRKKRTGPQKSDIYELPNVKNSAGTPSATNSPGDFWDTLLEIHRYRLLRISLSRNTNSIVKTEKQAAVLALLWEVDTRQRGELSQRLAATDLGHALGLERSAWSEQTRPLSKQGLCEALPREPGLRDRRKAYYVVTEKGKEALKHWLKSQYSLRADMYDDSGIQRARQVLEKLRAEVKDLLDSDAS